jgi:hypothetical protein
MLVKSASDIPLYLLPLFLRSLLLVLLFGVWGIDNVSRNRSSPVICARSDVFLHGAVL